VSSSEQVIKTITFQNPERLVYQLPPEYGTDFYGIGMQPSPDARRSNGTDEWGTVWHNAGVSNLGEAADCPLKSWADFDKLHIPDISDPLRWKNTVGCRERAGDKFLLGGGISIYERLHFLRGLENTWADLYEERENLCRLIDILVEMNLYAIRRYAALGVDGLSFCDDWGLQDRLMIHPDLWREIWKPRYKTIFEAAHSAGLYTFMHSCGHITAILGDLIDCGLDVIKMDQQENMGLAALGDAFRGRITFFCPVDIQNTMARGNPAEIRAYCREMVKTLGSEKGGFIADWYADPKGAGHSKEAIHAMCDEFLAL